MRWVAIRHADDHVHIVALLARQDGGKAFVWRDFFQVADACHAAEQRYGLTPTPPCDRTAARRPTRAKEEKAAGTAGPSRHGSPCGGMSPPPRPPPAASRSPSRCLSRWPVCGSGSGTAAAIPGRSPGTRSGWTAIPAGMASSCGTAAASWPPTSPCRSCGPAGTRPAPAPGRAAMPGSGTRRGTTPPAPRRRPVPRSGTCGALIRPPPATSPGPPQTCCGLPRPRWAVRPWRRPRTPTTGPPASPGAATAAVCGQAPAAVGRPAVVSGRAREPGPAAGQARARGAAGGAG